MRHWWSLMLLGLGSVAVATFSDLFSTILPVAWQHTSYGKGGVARDHGKQKSYWCFNFRYSLLCLEIKSSHCCTADSWLEWFLGHYIYLRSTPHPVTVTTRIVTFLVGNPYKPSFATVTGWGVDPIYTLPFLIANATECCYSTRVEPGKTSVVPRSKPSEWTPHPHKKHIMQLDMDIQI